MHERHAQLGAWRDDVHVRETARGGPQAPEGARSHRRLAVRQRDVDAGERAQRHAKLRGVDATVARRVVPCEELAQPLAPLRGAADAGAWACRRSVGVGGIGVCDGGGPPASGRIGTGDDGVGHERLPLPARQVEPRPPPRHGGHVGEGEEQRVAEEPRRDQEVERLRPRVVGPALADEGGQPDRRREVAARELREEHVDADRHRVRRQPHRAEKVERDARAERGRAAHDEGVRRGWRRIGAEDHGARHHLAVEELELDHAVQPHDERDADDRGQRREDGIDDPRQPLVGLREQIRRQTGVEGECCRCEGAE